MKALNHVYYVFMGSDGIMQYGGIQLFTNLDLDSNVFLRGPAFELIFWTRSIT
jgi:hypothetical protein